MLKNAKKFNQLEAGNILKSIKALKKTCTLFFRVESFELNERRFYMEKVRTDSSFKAAYGISLLELLYINQLKTKDSRYKICKQILLTAPVVIYTKKDFFLLDALDNKIEKMKSAGLIELWLFRDVDKDFLNYKEKNPPMVLNISRLLGCFEILILGLTISCVVFVFEYFSLIHLLRDVCFRQ